MPNLPYIPETITVHLGPPNASAPNETLPFADYIKNVASSEIYPTWPESALRANIYAQISFALNRVYTEYYRSRGYDFDITNSTGIDQSFVYGRDIFENISQLVDELFNTYVRRIGNVEPLFTQYCNGTTVTCDGLSQWGTVPLAEQGLVPFEILQYYYGDDIELVRDAPVRGLQDSYPDRILALGTSGNDVARVQTRLNRISSNYPAIPKIAPVDGVYGPETEAAVRQFQSIFNLAVDGVVGEATWYAIQRIYAAVKRLSELSSEGLTFEDVSNLLPLELSEGSTGAGVFELQYFLAALSLYVNTIPTVVPDGIFGPRTREGVIAFQQLYGITPTGVVDTATFEAIYRSYLGIVASLPDGFFDNRTLAYPGYPLRIGFSGEYVTALQEYLNFIGETYPQIPSVTVDGVFGASTQSAVRAYQELFGLAQSGIVGALTWDSITSTYRDLTEGQRTGEEQFPGGGSFNGM